MVADILEVSEGKAEGAVGRALAGGQRQLAPPNVRADATRVIRLEVRREAEGRGGRGQPETGETGDAGAGGPTGGEGRQGTGGKGQEGTPEAWRTAWHPGDGLEVNEGDRGTSCSSHSSSLVSRPRDDGHKLAQR